MCALLWEAPGRSDDLAELVDDLLAGLRDAGAVPVQRWHRDNPEADADPAEMHLVEWPEGADYDRWRFAESTRDVMMSHNGALASWQTFWMRPQ